MCVLKLMEVNARSLTPIAFTIRHVVEAPRGGRYPNAMRMPGSCNASRALVGSVRRMAAVTRAEVEL